MKRRGLVLPVACVTAAMGLLASFSSIAQAQTAGLVLQVDSQFERSMDPTRTKGLRDVHMNGFSALLYGGGLRGGLSAFGEAALGVGLQGGLAYRLALVPFGAMLYDKGQHVLAGLSFGVQTQGVTRHQEFVVQAPLRLSLHLNLHRRVLLTSWLSHDFSLRETRGDGRFDAFGADEVRAGLGLRLRKAPTLACRRDKRGRTHSESTNGGYYLGVLYAERFGTTFWGLSLGYGIESATRQLGVP